MEPPERALPPVPTPPFGELVRASLRVGVQSFGGPVAHIAVQHRVFVEEKRWVSEERFLHALDFCMLLPGPEATQLATYVGWLLHGVRGGIVAGALFVLPGALCMGALAAAYVLWRDVPLVDALFLGVRAAVLAIVAEALLRIGRRALRTRAAVLLALLAFAALFAFRAPFPVVVGAAALAGLVFRDAFRAGAADAPAERARRPSVRRLAFVVVVGVALWFAPVALAAALLGPDSVLAQQGLFFSRAAVVTFGGAYAVLGYLQQTAGVHEWVTPELVHEGLGLGETTPGPLILVLEFVAFVGGARVPQGLPPLAAGALGAGMMLWTTFVPCFLWIFAFAPWVEAARGVRRLSSALAAVTAAVVGVVASLAAHLTLHTLFRHVRVPDEGALRLPLVAWESVDVVALAVACGAAVLLFRLRAGIGWTLVAAALAGVAGRLIAAGA